ncbi:MAG: PqqD family protein [Eubacterium sp.]
MSLIKANDDFVLRKIGDDSVLVPINKAAVDFGGLVLLNETGAYLWECLLNGEKSLEELAECIVREYEVDMETALADTKEFIEYLNQREVLV